MSAGLDNLHVPMKPELSADDKATEKLIFWLPPSPQALALASSWCHTQAESLDSVTDSRDKRLEEPGIV